MKRVPLPWRDADIAGAWRRLPPGPRALAPLLAAWIAVVLVLAGADLSAGGGEEGASGGSAAPAPGAAGASLTAIAERPLFSVSRRPAPPPPAVAAPPPAPPAPRDRQISLKGVYIDGTRAKAFVTSTEQPDGAWVSAGSRIGGWQVAAVSAGEVRFEAGGESFSAPLHPVPAHP